LKELKRNYQRSAVIVLQIARVRRLC